MSKARSNGSAPAGSGLTVARSGAEACPRLGLAVPRQHARAATATRATRGSRSENTACIMTPARSGWLAYSLHNLAPVRGFVQVGTLLTILREEQTMPSIK